MKEKIVFILVILYLIQNPLGQVINAVNYLDEGFTLLGLYILLIKVIKCFHQRIYCEKWLFRILLCLVFMIVIGICGNIAWGYQKMIFVLLDMVSFMKFFVGLLVGYLFSVDQYSNEFKKKLLWLCKIIVVLQFILSIHEQLFTPWFEYLYGWKYIKAIKLYYTTQTYLVAYSVFCLAIFFLLCKNNREKIGYGILTIIPIILTMRSKAWGFLVLFFIIVLITRQLCLRTPFGLGIFSLPMIIIVAWDKIKLYFLDSTHYSPRLIILQDGWALAQEHFPLGTGFGTFCSVGAAVGGSPIYDLLGLDYTSEYIGKSINDMYWGYLLGQFGFMGTIVMLAIIVELIMAVWKLQSGQRDRFMSGICLIIYIIIASIGESPFFASYIMGFAFLIGSILGDITRRRHNEVGKKRTVSK